MKCARRGERERDRQTLDTERSTKIADIKRQEIFYALEEIIFATRQITTKSGDNNETYPATQLMKRTQSIGEIVQLKFFSRLKS